MKIDVTLPANRALVGQLSVTGDDGANALVAPCLGKADNQAAADHGNPARDPVKSNGDTPAGTYDAHVGVVELPEHSYGPHPVIHLSPRAGQALDAAQNGRSGLLIHSGPPGATGALRPTHGCLRVTDDDQAKLVALMGDQTLTCEVVQS